MDQRRTVTISLELVVVGDDLSGRVISAGCPVRDFSGWIGLMSAIEALLAGDLRARASRDEDRTRAAPDGGEQCLRRTAPEAS